jgi:hypothetical protein
VDAKDFSARNAQVPPERRMLRLLGAELLLADEWKPPKI